MNAKVCSKCKVEKSFDFFGLSKRSKDSKMNYCKICNNKYYKQYISKYRKTEKYKQYQSKYRKTEKYKQYLSEYRKTEKYKQYESQYRKTEKCSQRLRTYYKKNAEKRKKIVDKYRKKNPEKYKQCMSKYKQKQRDELNDKYLIKRLKTIGKMYYKYFIVTPELIEAKRAQLQLIRSIKEKFK